MTGRTRTQAPRTQFTNKKIRLTWTESHACVAELDLDDAVELANLDQPWAARLERSKVTVEQVAAALKQRVQVATLVADVELKSFDTSRSAVDVKVVEPGD